MAKTHGYPILQGTVASVLAAAIYALLAWLVPGWYHQTLSAGSFCWQFLVSPSGLPHWALLILVVLSLPTVVRLARLLLPTRSQRPATRRPQFTDYTQDTFLGVVWRWNYQRGEPVGIVAFCPVCDTQLGYNEPFVGISVNLVCDECEQVVYSGEGGLDHTVNKVARQVERKLRLNEWRQAVQARRETAADGNITTAWDSFF